MNTETEPYIPPTLGPRRARAWFDTVFNPYLRGLEHEKHLLQLPFNEFHLDPYAKGNYTFRWSEKRLEYIGHPERWVDYSYYPNLDDVRQSLPEFADMERRHQEAVTELYNACLALFDGFVALSPKFIEIVEGDIKHYHEHTSPYSPNEYKNIEELLAKDPGEIVKDLAEILINNAVFLRTGYIYSEYFNRFGSNFKDLRTDPSIIPLQENLQQANATTITVIDAFTAYIIAIRRGISDKLDIPFSKRSRHAV